MKKFYTKAFYFVAIGIVSYPIFILIWGTVMPVQLKPNIYVVNENRGDRLFQRLENVKDYNNIDILFLGSSHVYRQFDTRIFKEKGYKTFNLGSSGQTPVQSLLFLKKYIDKLNPKIIVFETFPFLFLSDNIESELNLILNGYYKLNYENIFNILKTKNIKLINSYIYQALIGYIRKGKLSAKMPNYGGTNKYIEGGYLETIKNYDTSSEIPYKSKIWRPIYSQQNALDSIVYLIRERNKSLILVQTPMTKLCYNYILNNEEIDKYFSSKGVYYNFNKIMNLNDTTYFYDTNHLNQKGVDSFNRAFIRMCLNH